MQPIIQVENLTKRYKNAATHAVDGVSFTVVPGEFFTLLGLNGAGKTTTISILTTTLATTSGTARIAGYHLFYDFLAAIQMRNLLWKRQLPFG